MIALVKHWRVVLVGGVMAAAFAAGWKVADWRTGAREAAALKAQIEARDKAAKAVEAENARRGAAEVKRLAAQTENYALGRKLEDQAYADTSNGCGLSAGRVERLRQR